jgi:hypothetical protein
MPSGMRIFKMMTQLEQNLRCCRTKFLFQFSIKAIHYKRERRPITLELQEREEHLRAARNYGEEAEEKDREEGEGREPREEA